MFHAQTPTHLLAREERREKYGSETLSKASDAIRPANGSPELGAHMCYDSLLHLIFLGGGMSALDKN